MTKAFIEALQRSGFALISNDRGHCSLVLTGAQRCIHVAASATAAIIEHQGPDGDYSVMLSRVPDELAVRIVEAMRA